MRNASERYYLFSYDVNASRILFTTSSSYIGVAEYISLPDGIHCAVHLPVLHFPLGPSPELKFRVCYLWSVWLVGKAKCQHDHSFTAAENMPFV